MLTVIGIMAAGIFLGYLLRKKRLAFVPKIISLAIYALLFFLGITVGANRDIMDKLGIIGLDALVITSGAVIGSAFAALFIYKRFFKEEKK